MAIYKLKLPRLTHGWDKQPQLLERYWDILCNLIEEAVNQILELPIILDALNQAIEDAQNAADSAQSAADSAQNAADSANNAAASTTAEQSIVSSFPTNFIDPLISANSAGIITIANHDRQYGDTTLNPTVSVVGDIFSTGQSNPAVVRVYYNDPTRAGGAVTYLYTVDPADPPVQGGDVHSIGSVQIPSGGSSGGGPVRPPGWTNPIP